MSQPTERSGSSKIAWAEREISDHTAFSDEPAINCEAGPETGTQDQTWVGSTGGQLSAAFTPVVDQSGSWAKSVLDFTLTGLTDTVDTTTTITSPSPCSGSITTRYTGTSARDTINGYNTWDLPLTTSCSDNICTTEVTGWRQPAPGADEGVVAQRSFTIHPAASEVFTEKFEIIAVSVEITKLVRDSPPQTDTDSYSIPDVGEHNTFERTFLVQFKVRPAGLKLSKVTVEAVGDGGTVLQRLYAEPPGNHAVLAGAGKLRAMVTFNKGLVSHIDTSPPPTTTVRYRFKLDAKLGDIAVDDSATTPPKIALFHMPAGVPRYGQRDTGGDDWCAASTYTWIDDSRSLLRFVDDVSGEHGRNIGHKTHKTGKDIDEYHALLGPTPSGSGFYRLLQTHAVQVAEGHPSSMQFISHWIMASREYLDRLAANAQVARLFYMYGVQVRNAHGDVVLGAGWARDLLRNGRTTSTDGFVVNPPAGAWAPPAKLTFDSTMNPSTGLHVHDTHIHISLH